MTTSFMKSPSMLLTSESVTEGHPDKLCDLISDAVLDSILTRDPMARVACETMATTGLVVVMGEITTDCYIEIPQVVRDTIHDVGYTRAKYSRWTSRWESTTQLRRGKAERPKMRRRLWEPAIRA